MTTQTQVLPVTLPVVNLLPPEIGEQRTLRKVKLGLGAGLIASVGVVALLYSGAAADRSSAQENLTAAQARGASLNAQTAKYADVPAVIARVDAAKLQKAQAMAPEIRWSFYLNDLSLRIPAKVWLTQITATQVVDGAATSATTAATATAGGYPEPGIGQLTFEGQAYGHNDVASWLQMLARERGWIQAYFTDSSQDESLEGPGGEPAVKFTSQVTVTEDALSRRFEQKAGS